MAKDPGVRRIVVGVDGSAESVAALRWACREASLRAARCPVVIIGAVDMVAPDPPDHVPDSWQRRQSYLAGAR